MEGRPNQCSTHPEDEVKSKEQVLDALGASFHRHGVAEMVWCWNLGEHARPGLGGNSTQQRRAPKWWRRRRRPGGPRGCTFKKCHSLRVPGERGAHARGPAPGRPRPQRPGHAHAAPDPPKAPSVHIAPGPTPPKPRPHPSEATPTRGSAHVTRPRPAPPRPKLFPPPRPDQAPPTQPLARPRPRPQSAWPRPHPSGTWMDGSLVFFFSGCSCLQCFSLPAPVSPLPSSLEVLQSPYPLLWLLGN